MASSAGRLPRWSFPCSRRLRLGPPFRPWPRYPREFRLTAGVAAVAIVLGIAFPLAGFAILAFATRDFLTPRRLKEAGVGTNEHNL